MGNDPAAAVPLLERVIAYGETPYLAEAHFYAAKGLLRVGRKDAAVEHLRWLTARDTEQSDHARALADSVESRSRH